MLSLFQKARVENVTLEDLQELCEQGAEEGHTEAAISYRLC